MAFEAHPHPHPHPHNQQHHPSCGEGATSSNSIISIEGTFHRLPPLASIVSGQPPCPVAAIDRLGLLLRWPPLLSFMQGLWFTTGKFFYIREAMSQNGKSPRLDLKLNLSTPAWMGGSSRRAAGDDSPQQRSSSSSPSSCVSSEDEQGMQSSDSPEATSMVLAACPHCLMYVMLRKDDPKCPKCHSAHLLDFLHDNTTTKKTRK